MKGTATPGAGIRVSPERLLPLWVTGGFFALGLLAFAVIPLVVGWARKPLADGIFAHHGVVLLAHLFALGWGTSVALGAWQQLGNVAWQSTPPPRTTYAKASFPAYLAGVAILSAGMASSRFGWASVGGALIGIAVLLSLITSVQAIRRAERGSVMLPFAAPAFFSLVLVAAVGVMLAINRSTGWLGASWYPAIAAHLYLGPAGWFGLLIPGVSYELAPFFGLTTTKGEARRGRLSLVVACLLGLGLLGGLLSALFGFFHPIWLAVTGAGYLVFLADLRGVYGRRPARRQNATLTGVRAAHAYLSALALWLLWETLLQGELVGPGFTVASGLRRWTLAGWFAGAGWLSNSIVAYLHRILPFLLWHSRYWGKPKEEVKTGFPRMVDQQLGRVGLWVYNIGVVGTGLGLWLRLDPVVLCGVLVLAVGTWMLTFNLGRAYWR